MKTRSIFFFFVFFVLVLSSYSQEFVIVPDSIWVPTKKVIMYGKEQAAMGNLKIVESIENDERFLDLSIEAKFNFYDQTQLGFSQSEDFDNAKKYELKAIHLASENNREDLNFTRDQHSSVFHNYYWVACYETYKGNLDSAAHYSLLHLSKIKDYYGLQSKELLRAVLFPTIFCKTKTMFENLDFGSPNEECNDSIKPKLIIENFKDYHDAIKNINHLCNEYQYSDSLLLGEIMWHKGDHLFHTGNIEEGLSLMYQSIAVLSKSGLCLMNYFEGGLEKIIYLSNLLMYYQDDLTVLIVNRFLIDIVCDKFDDETQTSIKSNIVSSAIRLWLFDYADKYLTDLESRGGDEYRIAQNKYYRGLYYFELANKEQKLEPLYKAIPYYEDIIENSWHRERMNTHQQLMRIYNVIGTNTGDFSKLEKLQEKMFDIEKDNILKRLSCTTVDPQYNPLSGMDYIYSIVNSKTTEQFLEHLLFKWSIVTEFSKKIEELSIKDRILSNKWKTIKDMKSGNGDAEIIDALEHELMSNINFKKIKESLNVDISKTRKKLDDKDLFIAFIQDDFDSLYALSLSKKLPSQKILASDLLTKHLLERTETEIANEISSHLCPYLKDYKNVYLLITDSLYKVPIEKCIMSYNKNVNVHRVFSFRDIKSKEKKIKNVVAFGDPNLNSINELNKYRGYFYSPLPGTSIEIDSISEILNRRSENIHVKSFVKNNASEENFKSFENSVVNLIHFATHAFLGKQRIFDDSGLLLSGANIELNTDSLNLRFSNDGILRACEIENLRFNDLELVVLSACETGAGGSDVGYGVLGLPLAFHKAGAKRLIVSLKKVDDDLTQAFMIKFYKCLASGKSIYNSFWEAMDNADEETRNSFILIE